MSPEELNRRAIVAVYNEMTATALEIKNEIEADILHEETIEETIEVMRAAHAVILRMITALLKDQESNLVKHARRELEILGEDPETIQSYLEIVRVFASQGHSGGSASVFIPTIMKLLSFDNLTQITDDPAEWFEVGDGMWQNVRNSKFFSEDGGLRYYDVEDKYDESGACIKTYESKRVRD